MRLYKQIKCCLKYSVLLCAGSKPIWLKWKLISPLGFLTSLALKNCGYKFPSRKLIINLAPADRRKEGSMYDLPIALGMLAHLEIFPAERLQEHLYLGELALDGRIKRGRGILSSTVLAKGQGFGGIVVPKENEREAALVSDIDIFGLKILWKLFSF